MKILIITAFFPPQNSIASLRPYSWAKYWSRAGHDVTVLTIPKKSESSDLLIAFDGFQVLEVPIPGIQIIRRLIGNRMANGISSSFPMDSGRKQKYELGFKRYLHRVLFRWQRYYGIAYGCRMPDPMDLWSGVAYRTVCNDSWHLVVSTAGPYSVHAPAYRLRRAGLTKHWIADWRDLWTDNHLFPGLPLFRNIECWLEQRWCRLADHITTVSEPLADTMRSKYGDKVAVIYNGFDPEDYANLPNEKAFPDDDVFRLVYTGTFYKGKLDPTPVFAAVKKMTLDGKLTPAKLQILFCGQDTDVSDLAASHEVSGYVQCLGLVPRAKALHMQRDANALLFLGFETEKVKGILTGKLFEYLIAGPQILAVGINSDSSVGKLLRQTGNDFICGQDLDLVILNISLLMNMMKSSKSLAQNNEKYSLIGSFSRSMQADAMLSLAIIR